MRDSYQVVKITTQHCLSIEEQQRFWKRLHRYFLHHQRWWKPQSVWIDVIYRGEHPLTVYMTVPQLVMEQLPDFLRGQEKRGKKNSIQLIPCLPEELKISPSAAVCELKLAFENLFALPTSASLLLPEKVPLEKSEMARLSFGFVPIEKMGLNIRKNQMYKAKMETGFRDYRGSVDATGLFKIILYYLDQWTQRLMIRDQKGTLNVPWLSQDTLRKLNDCHYKAYIRIAGPQRILPRLARPFENMKGENELKIQFLPKREQLASLKELNSQKIGLYSRSDLNPNIIGSREISALLPFLLSVPISDHHNVRPILK